MSTNLTLLDLAARSEVDRVVGLIEDVHTVAPELAVFPVRPKAGTSYKISRRTGFPTAGFRAVNEGLATSKSTYVQDLVSMHFLDTQLEVDEAIVRGDDREIGEILADEAAGAFEGSVIAIGSQIWYGTEASADGFLGLRSQVVDEVGTATTTSTSAFLVDLSLQGVHLPVGENGQISFPEWQKQKVVKDNKSFMAWCSNVSGWIGLQVGSDASVFRVKGIKTDNTANYMTDQKAAQLLAKVPLRRRANLRWFMNRTAAYTLQLSRSSVGAQPANRGGLPAFAEMPTETQGIPITITDSLTDAEDNS
jgi:hypothetical protein